MPTLTDNKARWKRKVGAALRRMKPADAKAKLEAIQAETEAQGGATILHATIRQLTGGLNSQSINFYVVRKLHEKAQNE
jgi:hypothetical protein